MVWREGNTGHRDMRVVSCSGGVREPGMCGHSPHENRDTSGRSLSGAEAAMTEATGRLMHEKKCSACVTEGQIVYLVHEEHLHRDIHS